MLIIQLRGGLGNQMFQYAAAKALSLRSGSVLEIDLSKLERNFETRSDDDRRFYELHIFKNLKDKIITNEKLYVYTRNSFSRRIRRWCGLSHFKTYYETQFTYSDDFFQVQPPALISGYFQSQNYFINFKEEVQHLFKFPHSTLDNKNKDLLQQIINSQAISVHIRRGDYLVPAIQEIHGICSKTYYVNAINLIQRKYPKSTLYFFSDDPVWVKDNFNYGFSNRVYVEGNYGKDSWKDMYLMSNCAHNIIANSSFSWWGAWLNTNPSKMVIAPKKWFNIINKNYDPTTLLPPSWIKL